MTSIDTTPRQLDALLRAGSLVIVGASADPTRLGGMPIRSLVDGKPIAWQERFEPLEIPAGQKSGIAGDVVF